MSNLKITPLRDPAQVAAVYPHLETHEMRKYLPDSVFASMAEFTLWLAANDVRAWVVEAIDLEVTQDISLPPPVKPVGIFAFTDIIPGECAASHVFMWNHDDVDHAELVDLAKTACGAIMTAFDLIRLDGVTPTSNLPARVFLTRVGFVIEGRKRLLFSRQGVREDGWISSMTKEDLRRALGVAERPIPPAVTMVEEEPTKGIHALPSREAQEIDCIA